MGGNGCSSLWLGAIGCSCIGGFFFPGGFAVGHGFGFGGVRSCTINGGKFFYSVWPGAIRCTLFFGNFGGGLALRRVRRRDSTYCERAWSRTVVFDYTCPNFGFVRGILASGDVAIGCSLFFFG
jgi:hypothetical protein